MSKGYCIFAQNNSSTDYVRQAYALAVSIHQFNEDHKVSIITNDQVPEEYHWAFDNIIPIPWTDQAEKSDWKIENRWKVFHVTPYTETIVMDADMLVLENLDHWWAELSKRDLFFVSRVKNFRNEFANSRYYRKVFDSNNLPNLYAGLYYFKKNKKTQRFFSLLELVITNWELFYGKFAGINYQKWPSIDVSCAIACKLMGNESEITDPNSFISFTHMKLHMQGWQQVPEKWTSSIGQYVTQDGDLLLGNYKQSGILHYVEDDFLTDKILKEIETL